MVVSPFRLENWGVLRCEVLEELVLGLVLSKIAPTFKTEKCVNVIKWCSAYNSTSLGSGSWGHMQKTTKKKTHFHSLYCSVWGSKKVAQKWTKNSLMSGLISLCKLKYVSPWVMEVHGDAVTCSVEIKRPFKDVSAILRKVNLVQSILNTGTWVFQHTKQHLFLLCSIVGFGNLINKLSCHRESYFIKSNNVFHSLTTLTIVSSYCSCLSLQLPK